MTSFYTNEELMNLGLKSFGSNVLISRHCSIYGAKDISIGNNVRIDDFCILSGHITLGSNIHIAAYTALFGANGIILEDYTTISHRCTLLSASDNYNGDFLVGPINPIEKTDVQGGIIRLKKYANIAAHCLIMPNVTIEEGCVIGAMSQVRHSTLPWMIYIGNPVHILKARKRNMLDLFTTSL